MLSFLRQVLVFAAICGLAPAAFSQFGIPVGQREAQDKPVLVRGLVSQYCRLDYGGARLNAGDWTKLQPVVAWPKNPDYPLINVVSRYEVEQNVTSEHGRYLVTVHYHLLGRFNLGEGYTREVTNLEDVQFAVEEVNGEFKVAEIYPNYPRPSRAAMLKWLGENQSKAQDDHNKLIYRLALQDLQAQSGSPFAK